MATPTRLFIAGCLLGLGITANYCTAKPPTAKPPTVAAHLSAAEELVAHVQPQDTNYEHKAGTVVWRGLNGATKYECHTDCSGLFNHLLMHCYGVTTDEMKTWLGASRPTARRYFEAIEASQRFDRITRLDQARPGDILVVKYAPGEENTGHLMLIAGAPEQHEATPPLVAGSHQWHVPVIDSSMSGHGKNDTRHNPDGTYRNGIGHGTLRLYTDAAGHPLGYSWSVSSSSKFNSRDDRPLAIGRLQVQHLRHAP